MKKIVIIIGARPNFMKAFPVYEALKEDFELTLIHTGQHFDAKMSDIFFNQLKFPRPDISLTLEKKTKAGDFDDKMYVNNGEYLKDKNAVIQELMNYDGDLGQLGEIRDKLKVEFKKLEPDLVIVFGDVTSTLSAGLASKLLNIDIAHVESGLRSGDMLMPEEVNRVLTDHITKYYFITEQSGVDNLKAIGVTENVYLVGNTMIDTQKKYLQQALDTKYHETLDVKSKGYVLITLHRPSNVDDLNKLKEIFNDFENLSKTETLVYPIHPRTKNNLEKLGYLQKVQENPNIILDEPLGYLEFTCLMANCKYLVTDSGGLQEESTALNIPCFTLRENTERSSTLIENHGTNQLISKISEIELKECKGYMDLWDGKSSERINNILSKILKSSQKNILICFGTRPEYIKVKSLIDNLPNIKTCFTGQHTDLLQNINADYKLSMDKELSENRLNNIFSNILSYNIFEDIEYVMVQGDTSTACAMALSAFNHGKKIIHLEAGLRSGNLKDPFPEEMNRQVIGRIADIHLCPTEFNKENLLKENVSGVINVVGNTGLDNISRDGCKYNNHVLITMHRRDNHHNMDKWFEELEKLAIKYHELEFMIPLHPNPKVQKHKHIFKKVKVVQPMCHSDLISYVKKSKFVISDSGGLQEECSYLNKKIIVCRKSTERPESIGIHTFMCSEPELLEDLVDNINENYEVDDECPYGNGRSWEKIINILNNNTINKLNSKISFNGRQILDSRGNPTLEVDVLYNNKLISREACPSGSSTGSNEAIELRDNNNEYSGKSVKKAIENVQKIVKSIKPTYDLLTNQINFDKKLCELDGTDLKNNLGGNTTTAVSFAAAAAANLLNMELFEYFHEIYNKNKIYTIPTPMVNILNGGKHAGGNLKIQEFMIIPNENWSFEDKLHNITKVYKKLGKILVKKYGISSKNLGDEGGFAPQLDNAYEALSVIEESIHDAGFVSGKDIFLALDCASNEFYDCEKKLYEIENGVFLTNIELVEYYKKLIHNYPALISIEDGFHEFDYTGWKLFNKTMGDKIMIVGDDLFTTNIKTIKKGLLENWANCLLLKVNQIGTISEAINASQLMKNKDLNVIVSHRSGETNSSLISDLCVGIGAKYIKIGAPARGERVAKYNRLLRIEEYITKKL